MEQTRRVRREKSRLRRVLPCLGRNFVLIPVFVPDPPFQWGQAQKRLRDALLAAGAFEVAYGRFTEAILQQALTDEIWAGHLPEDARKLAPHIEEITVFCRPCIEDICCLVKRIEDGIPNCQPLQVDKLFIDYKSFRKEILHLGMPNFKCSSPRHARHVKARVANSSHLTELVAGSSDRTELIPESSDFADVTTEPSFTWKTLDEEIQRHYELNSELTGLSETTFQDLNCAVYRLFVNKDFLLHQSSKEDIKDSPFLGVLHKLLGGLMRMLESHFSQSEDSVDAALLQKLISFKDKVEILLTRLTELDLDGSYRRFISNVGIDWTAMLEVTVRSSLELQNSLQNIVSGLIDADRAGLQIDRNLLKDSIEILKASSLYETIVEVPYKRSAAGHYSRLSKHLIRILDIGEYVKKAEMFMDREVHFVRQFMDPKVESEIISLIVKEMIADHMSRLVLAADSHMSQLIAAGNYDDINSLFRLVLNLPDVSALLSSTLTGYVRRTLGVLVADKEKEPIEYIQLILDERQKFEKIIKQSLRRDMRLVSKFSFTLREISGESLHLPQYLSLYMDHFLVKKATDLQAKVGRALDESIILLSDFGDKSVFQIYYQRHLADRLLCGVYNEALQLEILSKLRLYCCPLFLNKVRMMICDMSSSEALMRAFLDSNLLPYDAIPICVRVLRSCFWPNQPATKCNLPDDIKESWEVFCDFYTRLYSGGRKMTWSPSLGNSIVTARLGSDQEYELILPLHHLCVLLLFNSANSLTYEEIQQRTCIPNAHLKKCLVALTDVGQNLLHKETSGQITSSDRFYVNDRFSSKLKKLRFASVVKLKDVHIVVDEDATTAIDSVIIKILKEKSAGLSFNGVVKALTMYLKTKFRVTPRAVQRRLITLIEWEVVRKEVRDRKVYYRYYMY